MLNIDAPPYFEGLRDDFPVTIYERNLPHWRQEGATYFVTFRLNDSLPAHTLVELKETKEQWLAENPPPHNKSQKEELSRHLTAKQEKWLDAGHGGCVLATNDCLRLMTGALLFFDSERYEVGAYVVMPNHVHCIVRPFADSPLERILQSWKRYVSRELGKDPGGHSGTLWFEESFDRIIRDSEHLWECVQYIGRNPAKARLSRGEYARWLRPEWIKLGWRFLEM